MQKNGPEKAEASPGAPYFLSMSGCTNTMSYSIFIFIFGKTEQLSVLTSFVLSGGCLHEIKIQRAFNLSVFQGAFNLSLVFWKATCVDWVIHSSRAIF